MRRDVSGIMQGYGYSVAGATVGDIKLLVPGIVTSYNLTLPAAQGGAGQVLTNNGSGDLTWQSGLTLSTIFSGDVSGTSSTTSVDRIRGRTVSAVAPTNAQHLIFDGTQYVAQTIPGDAQMTNAGVMTINNDAITTAKILNASVTNAKIVSVDWTKVFNTPTTIAGYGITDAVLTNAGGVQSMQASLDASKPAAAGVPDRVYISTDTREIYRSNGVAWVKVGSAANTTGIAPVVVTSGDSTPVISMTQANGTTNGYVTSTDWTTFNNKLGTATVFSGDVTGTYNATVLASVATAGTYAGAVTIDAKGRVISAANSLDLTN